MITTFLEIILHLDVHLANLTAEYGLLIYLILFLIIFAETGLVVTPFLPGDSLLFAVGAISSIPGSEIDITKIWILLILAAFMGDNTNYQVGKFLGPRVFSRPKSKVFNSEYLVKTQSFYEEHGAKTVLLARFMPIFRTFVPFVAGIGQMNLFKFMCYSLGGSLLWMSSFLGAGYYFGNIPSVKGKFHIVIITVILISFLPIAIGYFRQRKKSM